MGGVFLGFDLRDKIPWGDHIVFDSALDTTGLYPDRLAELREAFGVCATTQRSLTIAALRPVPDDL